MSEITLLLRWEDEQFVEKYDNFCNLQERVFTDLDISDTNDPLALSMLALTTKLYAQKLIKIQLDAIREETAKLASAAAAQNEKQDKKDKDKKKKNSEPDVTETE